MALQARTRTWIVLAIAPVAGAIAAFVAAAVGDGPWMILPLGLTALALMMVDRRWGWAAPLPFSIGYGACSLSSLPPWEQDYWPVYVAMGMLAAIAAVIVLRLLKVVIDILFPLAKPMPGSCLHCGYNLTGNVSGVCPECGHAVTATKEA